MGVQADDEHGRVRVERVLRAVAVVHVEIDDQQAVVLELRLEHARGQRDVVEQAEAHRAVGFGVVARGTHGAERAAQLAAGHLAGGRDHAAGG